MRHGKKAVKFGREKSHRDAMMRNFNGLSDFSCAVGIYLDEIEALDVPLENRNDHICALARQYLAPAVLDIQQPAPLAAAAHQGQPDLAAG